MSNINQISSAAVKALQQNAGVQQPEARADRVSPPSEQLTSASAGSRADSVEFSDAARASSSGEIRTDLVASIKAQIESGTYLDDAKIDAALDGLTDELFA
jgi:anti-sigma28 factor (negative regulator of flagellin synthesis)